MTIEHFRDGKIIRHHRVADELGLQRQLGAISVTVRQRRLDAPALAIAPFGDEFVTLRSARRRVTNA